MIKKNSPKKQINNRKFKKEIKKSINNLCLAEKKNKIKRKIIDDYLSMDESEESDPISNLTHFLLFNPRQRCQRLDLALNPERRVAKIVVIISEVRV